MMIDDYPPGVVRRTAMELHGKLPGRWDSFGEFLEDLEAPFWIIQTPETIRNLPGILKIACIEVSLTDFNTPNLKILYGHHDSF